MLVPYRWLTEYVEIDVPCSEVAAALTGAGIEVGSIHRSGIEADGIVCGRVLTVTPHPDADRLVVADIDAGDRTYQVVTGAPNISEKAMIVLAIPGAQLGDQVIEAAAVRGVESQGMLCSASELGLFEDRSKQDAGILILDQSAQPGQDAARHLGLDDLVMDLDLTPNRADCLSMIGVAREVAAVTGARLRLSDRTGDDRGSIEVPIHIEDPADCARYAAKIADNVTSGQSPDWMRVRLRAAGMRPINALVDITNYVMLEYGQPLHAFDLDTLAGPRIEVRRASAGERLVTLDGTERLLDSGMLVIADSERPVALAGVIGGLDTEVTAKTRRILFESANFLPPLIRRTARRLGIRSEAHTRFERGVDPELAVAALDRVVDLIERLNCARPCPGLGDEYPGKTEPDVITIRPRRINALLGTELHPDEMAGYLDRLGFSTVVTDRGIDCQLTSRRRDVVIEADFAEEIARLHGYDRIPATLPRGQATVSETPARTGLGRRTRDLLIACGLTEVVTYSFISPDQWDRWEIPDDHPWRFAIPIQNPLSEDRSIMRTTLLPGVIGALATNASRQIEGMACFEVGSSFIPDQLPLVRLPAEPLMASGAAMGRPAGRRWNAPDQPTDFYWAKGVWEAIAEAFRITAWTLEPLTHPAFHPGRSAKVVIGNRTVGIMGELSAAVIDDSRLPRPAAAFEFELGLLGPMDSVPLYRSLPRQPAALRDLAVVVSDDVPAGRVLAVIRDAGTELLEDLRLFDEYRGENVGAGRRSLAYALTFRHPDRTLTDREVDGLLGVIASALAEHCDAHVRS